jgi:hypothetical protein
MQECAEEDPNYLLKLCSLYPEPSYVPTFLRSDVVHRRLGSELPFSPLESIQEAMIFPLEKQVGNLAEVAETVLTLINNTPCNVDSEDNNNCCEEDEEEHFEKEEEDMGDCQQSPAKQECCYSVVEQQAPENYQEDEAAESPMPKQQVQEEEALEEEEELRYIDDVPVYSDDEGDDCGGDWDAVAPPMFAVPLEDEEGMDYCEMQSEQVKQEEVEDEFIIKPAARVRRIESPPKCEEVVPVVAPPAPKKVRITEPDTPQVSFYRKRLEQAIKFQDIQSLAEVVFEIKCAELEDWFDIEAAEELIFQD